MEDYYAGKGQSVAYTEKPVNAFDNLGEAVSSLREVQKMAVAIAERLTGSHPANGTEQKLQAVAGGGLIDGVARQASIIREICDDIYASLSRIENRL